jgi:hypothetical protein
MLFFVFFLSFFVAIILFIISVHHINNYFVAVKIIGLKKLNDQCKILNSTHSICLPNVFLIGVSKCGTTSLVNYLSQHQNIKFVKRRIDSHDKHMEVHRFDRKTFAFSLKSLELADEWASSPIINSINSTQNFAVLHYTPHYLYAPTVPFEMKNFYSHSEKLKFIVMLRNPVDRAVSSYCFKNSKLFNDNDKGIKNSKLFKFYKIFFFIVLHFF